MRLVLIATIALLALLAPAAALPADDPHVAAAGVVFAPAVVTATVGQPITWEGTLIGHTVTTADSVVNAAQGQGNDRRNEDADPDTFHANLPQGGVVTHAFSAPGTYTYFCVLHFRSGMVGTVIVSE